MALRARLASLLAQESKPHEFIRAQWTVLPSHLFWRGDRRMEADTYLSGGHGMRVAIEERAAGWKRLGALARVWQPSRLKGVIVGEEGGTPFLTASQVFESRPVARKWLALDKTGEAASRFVDEGTILVTCSGSVGRSTLGCSLHANALVSHDLLRISPDDPGLWGWVYAFLQTQEARAMMIGAQYGHLIKHLEASHLRALPIPIVRESLAKEFQARVRQVLELRNRAHGLLLAAEARFASAIGDVQPSKSDTGFEVRAMDFASGRRRLEAAYYSPVAGAILQRFREVGVATKPLKELAQKVWWGKRFRRFYGDSGIPYLSGDELFSINPEMKRILVSPDDNHEDFYVQRGWLVMACSGQSYGLNGATRLATKHDEGIFFSHDLIRIVPKEGAIRPGYLLTALTHPVLGRPLLIRYAYGTSIQHLDPSDVSEFPVVRTRRREEEKIADLAEESSADRAQADVLERELAADASLLVGRFLSGDSAEFVTTIHAAG